MEWGAGRTAEGAQEAAQGAAHGIDPVTGEELQGGDEEVQAGGETCLPCRISKVRCDKQMPCGRCRRRKMMCIPQTVRRGRSVARSR